MLKKRKLDGLRSSDDIQYLLDEVEDSRYFFVNCKEKLASSKLQLSLVYLAYSCHFLDTLQNTISFDLPINDWLIDPKRSKLLISSRIVLLNDDGTLSPWTKDMKGLVWLSASQPVS